MRIIRCDEGLRHWVESQIDSVDCLGPSENLAVVSESGELIAGVIYHNYRPPSIEITIAAKSPRWCLPGIVRELLAYPFRQLGCRRITIMIAESNTRSLRVMGGLGFVREGYLREAAGDGGALVLFGMTKQDFESGKYGKERT